MVPNRIQMATLVKFQPPVENSASASAPDLRLAPDVIDARVQCTVSILYMTHRTSVDPPHAS